MPTPHVPAQLKLLRGNPGKERIREGLRPEQSADVPDPPAFITGYAADEWYCVATELHRLGVLTKIDLVPLAAYCQTYAVWREATEQLAAMHDQPTKGFVVRSANGAYGVNPLLYIQRTSAAELMRFAAEFGLSPAARSRISGGTRGDEIQASKFDGLLAK
jgi:P27 family predicted phage terminase small subunit